MEEEIQLQLEDTQEKMQKALQHLEDELLRIRAGKATPNILKDPLLVFILFVSSIFAYRNPGLIADGLNPLTISHIAITISCKAIGRANTVWIVDI